MTSRILNTLTNAIDNKEEVKKRSDYGNEILQELSSCIQNCQTRFGGKSELATEDDIRIIQLCDRWEKVLSHGIRTNLTNSAIQSLVTAGLNFTFNIVNVGNSLWSYTCLHLTKHEKERFKILSHINSPVGYFRAFLRAALNERSLERYLQSWINHGLLLEYYDDGSLVRSSLSPNLLTLANGLTTILFALSIDRAELNETQQTNHVSKAEHVIPLPTPVKPTTNLKKKPLRQVISFEKNHEAQSNEKNKHVLPPITDSDEIVWSAPPTCLNSPDSNLVHPNPTSTSEPTSSEVKTLRQFFPESVRTMDSPSQILTRLSECAKEIFSSSPTVHSVSSEISTSNLKISESDSEDIVHSIDGSTSCLELCFTEDESVADEKTACNMLAKKEQEFLALQFKYKQIEIANKEKVHKLEQVILDLSKENDRLKEQLHKYISAVEIGKALKSDVGKSEENNLYEKKLVQVAEMHAELMEFNQHLQRKLQELEGAETVETVKSNVKVSIPVAFLVGKTQSYHIYQVFLKVGQEEWNVYHRYAKFRELHMHLKKCHPDIASYKFPPKKALGKKDANLVEERRLALQLYLRHVILVLPELRNCTNRLQLATLLPFFGYSSSNRENGAPSSTLSRQNSSDSTISTYAAL